MVFVHILWFLNKVDYKGYNNVLPIKESTAILVSALYCFGIGNIDLSWAPVTQGVGMIYAVLPRSVHFLLSQPHSEKSFYSLLARPLCIFPAFCIQLCWTHFFLFFYTLFLCTFIQFSLVFFLYYIPASSVVFWFCILLIHLDISCWVSGV